MKKLRTVVTILFLSLILGGMTSCETTRYSENGRHRGWFHRHDDHNAVLIVTPDNRNNGERHEHHDNDNR